MKVWILQTGEPLQIDQHGMRPMRAINLSNALLERGHEVILWSSDFDHFSKTFRCGANKEIKVSNKFTIQLVKSRGYKSHVGLGRLIDHMQLAWNLSKLLRNEKAPDIAFIGYPPIEPAWVLSRWLHKKNVPFILDVKDAWPKLLVDAFPESIRLIARLVFHPYFMMMRTSFYKANAISSISDAFLDWSLKQIGLETRCLDKVTPLVSGRLLHNKSQEEDAAQWWDQRGILGKNKLRLYFVGSITESFDFNPFLEIARQLPIEVVIAGDGPKRAELLALIQNLPNVIAPGWITTDQASVLIKRSDLAIAPVVDREDFGMSIPNKFFDAMQHGKPIITSIKGPAADLLRNHKSGFTYRPDSDELKKLLQELINNPNIIEETGNNAFELYETKYNPSLIYHQLCIHLEQMVSKSRTT